jgi:hypothetical protein
MSSKRKTLKVLFMPSLRACTSLWPLASSVTMSTPQEQVQCMLCLAVLQSLTAVRCHFRTQYGCQPPTWKSIQFWDNKLKTIGSLSHVKSSGKTWTTEEKNVTGRSYLDMLELYALPQLPPQTILQQDVRNHLDREMDGRWIGRGGPIAWPPRLPDLTPLDFFLWGYV